ncbi:hypothetical protein AA313_de0202643 [Arthrobotrys entomopaga]|nr:hypothetical protein AA313_de0202643 [Arthrobotrys entomopaga]
MKIRIPAAMLYLIFAFVFVLTTKSAAVPYNNPRDGHTYSLSSVGPKPSLHPSNLKADPNPSDDEFTNIQISATKKPKEKYAGGDDRGSDNHNGLLSISSPVNGLIAKDQSSHSYLLVKRATDPPSDLEDPPSDSEDPHSDSEDYLEDDDDVDGNQYYIDPDDVYHVNRDPFMGGTESYEEAAGFFTSSQTPGAPSSQIFQQKPDYKFVRPYPQIVHEGVMVRDWKAPAKDVSPSGSDIITNPENGYLITHTKAKLDDESDDESDDEDPWPTYAIALYIVGEQLPPAVGYVGIENTPIDGEPTGIYDNIFYEFLLSANPGMIVIKQAFKRLDRAAEKEYKFSEIAYRVWNDFILDKQGKVTDLRYVLHDGVVNREGNGAVIRIFASLPWLVRPLRLKNGPGDDSESVRGHYIRLNGNSVYQEEIDAFNALVGYRTGKAVARMLIDHSNSLLQKRIGETGRTGNSK